MSKRKSKLPAFSDQLREAIREAGVTQYRICQETGIPEATLSRFMRGERGLQLTSIDALAAFLELRIIAERNSDQKGR